MANRIVSKGAIESMRLKPQRGVLTTAQGNALGKKSAKCEVLKGRRNSGSRLIRPYRAFLSYYTIPRALPWAIMGRPLGADEAVTALVALR